VIETILPSCVASAETSAEVPAAELFPEERALVATASPTRRAEFSAARHCAHRAMAELGLPPVPLLAGHGRAVRWPAGVVGSMAHCAGYRAAAVALSSQAAALGIDAAPHAALPAGVLGRVASAGEQNHLADLTRGAGEVSWDRVLFAAKESVYKAWFPLARRRLGFLDAEVRLDEPTGDFVARVLGPEPPIREYPGRFVVCDGLVLTAVAVAA
jgi:4'-phosphopantetheinyl transferase EntD